MPMSSCQICAGRARPSRSGHVEESQSVERMKALAQCRNASSSSTPITTFGVLPFL